MSCHFSSVCIGCSTVGAMDVMYVPVSLEAAGLALLWYWILSWGLHSLTVENNNSHGTDLSLEDRQAQGPHLISRQAQIGEEGSHNPVYTEESKGSEERKNLPKLQWEFGEPAADLEPPISWFAIQSRIILSATELEKKWEGTFMMLPPNCTLPYFSQVMQLENLNR